MITEKIKIYVTRRIADIVEKDAEGFEFFKSDGRTLNKNALLSKLIANYCEDFRKKQAELYDYLQETVSEFVDRREDADSLCRRISDKLNERTAASDGKFDVVLSLKPTKETASVLAYIENYLLSSCSFSEYLRNMLSSYASLPQDEREKIIFKPQYTALSNAIKTRKKVFVTTLTGKTFLETAPYALACSKEELHCYLLHSNSASGCGVLRLSRIADVVELSDDAEFTEQQLATFEKMLAYGPQFIYTPNEGEVCVELTDYGVKLFRSMYVHRPVPSKIEGSRYYFLCSHSQVEQYFRRFGRNAVVVYPKYLRKRIADFFEVALAAYNDNPPR